MSQIPSTESSVVKYIHKLSENVASAEVKMFADLKPYKQSKQQLPAKRCRTDSSLKREDH